MTKVNLPRINQTGTAEWSDVQVNDEANATVINGQLDHENLSSSAGITAAQLDSSAKPVAWYTPKVISAEESRTNTAFGTMATADEITGVVVPQNGLMVIGYTATAKSSVSGEGRAAIFIGSNQLKADSTGTVVVQSVPA